MISCKGDDDAAKPADRFRAGASFGYFRSDLTFFTDGPASLAIERRAVSASFDYRITGDTTLSFGAGASIGGRVFTHFERHDILPGWLVSFAYSRRLLDGRGRSPFLLVTASLGASGAMTRQLRLGAPGSELEAMPLYAIDVRGGLTLGKTFYGVLSPYGAVRAFGGPVLWDHGGKTITGTDRYHFQFSAGVVTALPRGFDLFAEISPLPAGERGITIGGGRSF